MDWQRAAKTTGATTSEYLVIAGVVVAIAATVVGVLGPQGVMPAVERLGSCIKGAVSGNFGACGGGSATAANTAAPAPAQAQAQAGCSSPGGLARCGAAAAAAGLETVAAATASMAASVQSGAAAVLNPAAVAEDPDGYAAPIIACAAQQAGIPAAILWALYRAGGVPPDPDKVAAVARRLREAHDRYGDWSAAVAAHQAGPEAVDASRGRMPDAKTAAFVNRVLNYARSPIPPAVSCK
jgi:hypothetical protein